MRLIDNGVGNGVPLSRRRFVRVFGGLAIASGAVLLAACQATTSAAPSTIVPTTSPPAATASSVPSTVAPTTAPPTATAAAAATDTPAAQATPSAAATDTPSSQPTPAPTAAAAPAGKPMYQMDPQHTGRSPYAGPTSLGLLRSFDMNNPGVNTTPPAIPRMDVQSSSIVGPDGTIYSSNFPGNLFALRDPGSGSSLELVWWFHPAGATPLHATPAIGPDGSVYLGFSAGTGTAAKTTFYAVKAPASGQEATVVWSVDFGAGRMTSSPTVGPDATIYAVSGPGMLYALGPNGSTKWTVQTGPTLRSSPALGADGTVYVGSSDGKLYAAKPPADSSTNTGTVAWTFDFGQHLGPTPLVTRAPTTGPGGGGGGGANGIGTGASATIGPDGTIYIGANNSNFYAIGTDGQMKWLYEAERELAGIWATAALSADGKALYFGANKGGIYALSSADGSLIWRFNIYGSVYSSPALDSGGTLYTASTVGHVFALNSTSGDMLADYDDGPEIWSAPSILPNSTLLVADRKGKVLLLGNG